MRHIEPYSVTFRTLCNPYIYSPYSELWNTLNPRHLQKPVEQVRWSSIFRALSERIVSLFKHFREFWGIFRDIDAYSATLTCAPLPFFENWKKHPDFRKKALLVSIFWVKFYTQNVVLKISRRKNTKTFSGKTFFFVFLTKCLSKCPSSTKPLLAVKNFDCAPARRHYSFCKMPHLKCLIVFWTCLSQ